MGYKVIVDGKEVVFVPMDKITDLAAAENWSADEKGRIVLEHARIEIKTKA